MKTIMAVVMSLLIAVVPIGFAQAQGLGAQSETAPTEPGTPYVEKIVFVGKGIGIPADGNLDDLKWINKIAVGVVKSADQEKRVGFLSLTDANGDTRYKIRNLVINEEEDTVTGDILDQSDSKAGDFSVSRKTIAGKEAIAGTMTIGSWSGNMVIMGHKVKTRPEFRVRAIAEERKLGDCTDDSDCEFRHHFRHLSDDARSRDFVREKCDLATNAKRCRTLIEEHKDAKIVGRALEVVPIKTLRKLNVRTEKLVRDSDIVKRFGAKKATALQKRLKRVHGALTGLRSV